jgi:hypothetical protein
MDIWELVAREEIRSCISRYNAYGDAGRMDDMMGVFADDAIMEIDGDPIHGREQISSFFRSAGRNFVQFAKANEIPRDAPILRHFTSTINITVDSPAEAHATLYYFVLMFHGLDHWGRYEDNYRLVGDTWLISHRREFMDGAVPGKFGAQTLARLGRTGY